MKILSGVYPHETYDGKVIYNGDELVLGASSIREAGEKVIAIVYQELTLVPTMTVGENVYLGREPVDGMSINWNKLYANTQAILENYQLDVPPQETVRNLGVGKMQMVEIAKALSENAKVLILDEPTSALSEAEVDKLMDILKTLKAHGITCIYITHKLEELFRITDRVTVMRDGRVVVTEPTGNLSVEKLVSHMVGREMKERFPKGNRKPGEVIFEVDGLQAVDPNDPSRKVLNGVSFNVRRGEILGIAGVSGNGQRELAETITGLRKVTGGKVFLEGKDITGLAPGDVMELGIDGLGTQRQTVIAPR